MGDLGQDLLVGAILAAPDDDAPRLVWADREGGERGELVVVQCALANRQADGRRVIGREERRRLVARERELLRGNEKAWSRLGDLAERVTFERGMLAKASIPIARLAEPGALDALFSNAPLLRELEVSTPDHVDGGEDIARAMIARTIELLAAMIAQLSPTHPLKSLVMIPSFSCLPSPFDDGLNFSSYEYADAVAAILAASPTLRGLLASLAIAAPPPGTFGGAPVVCSSFRELLRFDRLTSLEAFLKVEPLEYRSLFAAMPELRGLRFLRDAASHGEGLRTVLDSPGLRLVELGLVDDALRDDDLSAIAEARSLDGLQRLEIEHRGGDLAGGFERLAESRLLSDLRELRVWRSSDALVAILARSGFAAHLERLDLGRGVKLTRASIQRLVEGFPALEHLAFEKALPRDAMSALAAVIPDVVSRR